MTAELDWGLLAAAPHGTRHLRRLLVQLAVEGRLARPQPEDSLVDQLVARLREARDDYYATSGQRPARQIAEAVSMPFDLPTRWYWMSLGQLAHPQAGFAFKSSHFNESGDGLPLIRIRDVGQPFSGTYYSGEYRDEFIVRRGDFLISMDGEFRVAEWMHDEALLNQRVTRLQFFEGSVNRRFIAMSLQCRLHELQGVKTYTTVDHLAGGQIANAVIGLPPLEEQHRIVAKVDELMALCDRLEARQQDAEAAHARLVQALLDSLTQARDAEEFQACWQRVAGQFAVAFGTDEAVAVLAKVVISLAMRGRLAASDLSTRSKQPLVDLTTQITDGTHKTPTYVSAGIKFLSAKNVRMGVLRTDDCRFVSMAEHNELTKRCRPEAGDILLSKSGSIGTAVLVDTDEPFSIFESLALLKPRRDRVTPEYLRLAVQEACFQLDDSHVKGVGVKHLHLNVIRRLDVLVPSIDEQHRIVAKVTELLALCDQLKARVAAARAKHAQLAEALMHTAVQP